jgi:drug/metabolite transporter (DMT)-like permease
MIGLTLLTIALLSTRDGPLYSFPDRSTYICLVIGGLANCVSMNIQTYTTQHSKSGNIALLRFISVLYSFMVDLIIFRENFNWLQIFAISVILAVNVHATVSKLKSD